MKMERNTKRIIAIVAILAVAGAGIGIGVWWVTLPSAATNPFEYPGLDEKPPLSRTIKIGVLDDMSQTGIFSSVGAKLSAGAINAGGGIDIDGVTYYIGIVTEDTKEASYDNDAAIAAATKMVEYGPHAVLGGFRSETFEVYIQRVMEADIPFMITGSATTEFCQDWLGSPGTRDFYKWLFRCMPINSEHLGEHLSYLLVNEIIPNITAYQGFPVDDVKIVYEDLIWTADIKDLVLHELNKSFPNRLGPSNVSSQLIPKRGSLGGWEATDFQNLWTNIDSDGTQLVVPIISDMPYGFQFSAPYNTTKPDCLIAGINVAAQTSYHWSQTGGGCVYEITTHAIAYVNFTERSIPWYDTFVNATGIAPIYTGIGGSDAVNLFAHAIEQGQSLTNLDIVKELEKINETNPFPGINAWIGFDENHDVLETIPGVRDGFFSVPYRQYHPDGSLPLIPCADLYDWDSMVPLTSKSSLVYPDWWTP
jgi:branched-chain amino acid transport system substrate-binding protein